MIMKATTMKHFIALGLLTLVVSTMLSTAVSAQVPGPGPSAGGSPDAKFDAIIERLQAREGQDLKLYRELNDLLLDTPGLMATIPGIVRSGQVSLATSDTLIFAIEDVGSPAAQTLLVSILADGGQRQMDRLRGVMALGAQKAPTGATIDSLWAAAGQRFAPNDVDISNTALLALGVIGDTLRVTSAPTYAPLRDGLVGWLHGAADPFERAMALKAIGNTHDAALGNDVAVYLFDSSVSSRASAAQAIGMIRDGTKLHVLAGMLEDEPRGAVRAQVTEALRQIPADQASLQAVLARVQFDPHPEARAQMVSYLVEHLGEFEQARDTLRTMTFKDPTKRVRMLASASLAD